MNNLFSFISLLIIVVFGVFSCKNNQGVNPKFEDRLIIELEAIILENDHFELLYRRRDGEYEPANKKDFEIKGSKNLQVIRFVLDQHVYPQNVKLNLGRNESQGEIIIKTLTFKYNDAKHIFSKQEFEKYFKPSTDLVFDYETMIGQTKKIGNQYDPFFSSYNISKFINKLILY